MPFYVASRMSQRTLPVGAARLVRTASASSVDQRLKRTAPYTYDPNETDAQFDSLTDAQKDAYIATQPSQ